MNTCLCLNTPPKLAMQNRSRAGSDGTLCNTHRFRHAREVACLASGFPQTSPHRRGLPSATHFCAPRVRVVYPCAGIYHFVFLRVRGVRCGVSMLLLPCFAAGDLPNVETAASIRSTALHKEPCCAIDTQTTLVTQICPQQSRCFC